MVLSGFLVMRDYIDPNPFELIDCSELSLTNSETIKAALKAPIEVPAKISGFNGR